MTDTFKKWGYRALPASGLTLGADPFTFNGIAAEGRVFDVPADTGALPSGWMNPEDVGATRPARTPVAELPRAPVVEAPVAAPEPVPLDDLSGMDVEQLRALAASLGITVNQYWKKAKIISLINAARATE